ncbi:MAG: hypothetical protein AAGN35_12450 [Bacteroidota bacterium]
MRYKEIQYSAEQASVLEVLEMGRSVLKICVLEHRKIKDIYELAKGAAIAGMRVFQARNEAKMQRFNPGAHPSEYWQIKFIEGEEPVGKRTDPLEFCGRGYRAEERRVQLFGYGSNYTSRYEEDEAAPKGLVSAMFNPPYGFRVPGLAADLPWTAENATALAQAQTVFLHRFLAAFNIQLQGTPRPSIYAWSDNWSNFFDAGKEWWGTYYWTLIHHEESRATVIGASSTD